jgi:hypothetical protein
LLVSWFDEYHCHSTRKAQRCTLAVEYEIFSEEVRQLLFGQSKNIYRVLFAIRDTTIYVLYVRHSAQAPLTLDELEDYV